MKVIGEMPSGGSGTSGFHKEWWEKFLTPEREELFSRKGVTVEFFVDRKGYEFVEWANVLPARHTMVPGIINGKRVVLATEPGRVIGTGGGNIKQVEGPRPVVIDLKNGPQEFLRTGFGNAMNSVLAFRISGREYEIWMDFSRSGIMGSGIGKVTAHFKWHGEDEEVKFFVPPPPLPAQKCVSLDQAIELLAGDNGNKVNFFKAWKTASQQGKIENGFFLMGEEEFLNFLIELGIE